MCFAKSDFSNIKKGTHIQLNPDLWMFEYWKPPSKFVGYDYSFYCKNYQRIIYTSNKFCGYGSFQNYFTNTQPFFTYLMSISSKSKLAHKVKPEYTEVEIVAGCVQNNRTFQEILYRRHFTPMMQMCLRYTNGDRDRAFEVLNDGFLRIFKKIDTFEFKGSLEGWIRRLIFHAISDYFKSNKQYLETFIFDDDSLKNGATWHQKAITTSHAHDQLYFEDLLKLTHTLPPATREVFHLYAIDGYNHNDIAEKLNISVGTSKWHLSTAREKLKILIAQNDLQNALKDI